MQKKYLLRLSWSIGWNWSPFEYFIDLGSFTFVLSFDVDKLDSTDCLAEIIVELRKRNMHDCHTQTSFFMIINWYISFQTINYGKQENKMLKNLMSDWPYSPALTPNEFYSHLSKIKIVITDLAVQKKQLKTWIICFYNINFYMAYPFQKLVYLKKMHWY